jgi:hypothetical protein
MSSPEKSPGEVRLPIVTYRKPDYRLPKKLKLAIFHDLLTCTEGVIEGTSTPEFMVFFFS